MEEPKIKQFPLKTRGRCLICFRIATNRGGANEHVSLGVFCRNLEINVKDVYFKGLGTQAGSLEGAHLDRVELDMKAQLCSSCSRQIAEAIGCFRRLEQVKIEISNCLVGIQNKFVEANGKVKSMEMFRMEMMNDKFTRPYVGIVEELRKELLRKIIRYKHGQGSKTSDDALLPVTVVPERLLDPTKLVNLSQVPHKISRGLKKRPELPAEVVSISSSSSSDDDEVKVEPDVKGEEDVIMLDVEDEIDIPEDQTEPIFGTEEPENIVTTDPLLDVEIKEEDTPEEQINQPDPVIESKTNQVLKKGPITSNPIKCQICKIELSSPSLEVMQRHFSEAHPNIKIAKKCTLCKKIYLDKHLNCSKSSTLSKMQKATSRRKKRLETTLTKASPKLSQNRTAKDSVTNTPRKSRRTKKITSDENLPPKKKPSRPQKPPKPPKRILDPSDPLAHIPYKIGANSKTEITYKCHICSKIYKRRSDLRRHHFNIHLNRGRYRYACDQCSVSYAMKSLLERHKQIVHLGIGEYTCAANSKFDKLRRKPPSSDADSAPATLTSGGNRYQLKCLYGCDKEFTRHDNRRVHHRRVHIGKVFMCDACGKSFFMKNQLNYHIKVYHEGRRRMCEHCGKGFISNRGLQEHIQAIHGGVKYNCPFPGCKKTFKWKSSRLEHCKIFHPGFKIDYSAN